MSGAENAYLLFVSDGYGWNVNVADSGSSYYLPGHVFNIPFPFPTKIPNVGNVVFVRDALLYPGSPTGPVNLLCMFLPEPVTWPPRSGSYMLYPIHQTFPYHANIRVGNLNPATREILLAEFNRLSAPQPQPQPGIPPAPASYIQTRALEVPADELAELKQKVIEQQTTIEQLLEKLTLSSGSGGSRTDSPSGALILERSPKTPSPEVAELSIALGVSAGTSSDEAAPLPTPMSTASKVLTAPPKPNEPLETIRKTEFDTEFKELIEFYANTDDADRFMREALILCKKFPEFGTTFAANAARLVGSSILLTSLSKNLVLDPDDFTQNIYIAFYEQLFLLIKSGIPNRDIAKLDINVAGWNLIKSNLRVVFDVVKAAKLAVDIAKFCDKKIAALKPAQTTPPVTTVVPAQTKSAPTPAKVKTKTPTKAKKVVDEDDEFLVQIERERVAAEAAGAAAAALEEAKPAAQKFAELSSKLEDTDDTFLVDFSTLSFEPEMFAMTNAQGENLLLIALRNIKHRISLEALKGAKQLSKVATRYMALLGFLINNSDVLHGDNQNRSALYYWAEYGNNNVPSAIAGQIFQNIFEKCQQAVEVKFMAQLGLDVDPQAIDYGPIVKFWRTGVGHDGPTILHKLMEDPNNIGYVIEILTFMLEAQVPITPQNILHQEITPLLIAKYQGMNIRAKIEQAMLEQLRKKDTRLVTIYSAALQLLDKFYVKLGWQVKRMPYPASSKLSADIDDFYNLTGETNIIAPLLADAANGTGKVDREALLILARVLNERNIDAGSMRAALTLSGANIYCVFGSDDIIGTALGYLMQYPQRVDKAEKTIENWLKLEQFVAENRSSASPSINKGRLSIQLVATTAGFVCVATESQIPIIVQMIELIRARDPAASNIWVRSTMNAINLCFMSQSDERADVALIWMQTCVARMEQPECGFSTELESETKGVDANRNNVMHRLFLALNSNIMRLIMENKNFRVDQIAEKEGHRNHLITSIDLMLMGLAELLQSENAILNAHLKKQLAAENDDHLTPQQALLMNIGNDGREPIGVEIAQKISAVFDEFFPVARLGRLGLVIG